MMDKTYTTLFYTWVQLKRNFRDPLTLGVLFAIPVLLLVLFGSFARGGDISLKVAVINHSDTEFSSQFVSSLEEVDVLDINDESLTIDQAIELMKSNDLDGIAELPQEFGQMISGTPSGTVRIYYDEANATSGDIFTGVMNSVIEGTNNKLITTPLPLDIERVPTRGTGASPFDHIFAILLAWLR